MKSEVCEFRWLHLPYADVREVMLQSGPGLIQPAVTEAVRRSDEVLATLDADVAGRHVERQVKLSLGSVVDIGAPLPILKLPIKWHAATHPDLYPEMDGVLEAYPIAGDRTQLSVQGRYQPPFGKLGEVIDSLVLHKVAETAVEHFLEEVADRIASAAVGPTVDHPLPLTEPEADDVG